MDFMKSDITSGSAIININGTDAAVALQSAATVAVSLQAGNILPLRDLSGNDDSALPVRAIEIPSADLIAPLMHATSEYLSVVAALRQTKA